MASRLILLFPALLTSSVSGMHAERNSRALHGVNRRRSTRIGQRVNQGIWYKRKVIKSCLPNFFSSLQPQSRAQQTWLLDVRLFKCTSGAMSTPACTSRGRCTAETGRPRSRRRLHCRRNAPNAMCSQLDTAGSKKSSRRSADDDTARVRAYYLVVVSGKTLRHQSAMSAGLVEHVWKEV
ncbi:hypothetical protein BC567DRAFT_27076 [Phyllosticta citribraziliensis]